jgi:hypothetical protein
MRKEYVKRRVGDKESKGTNETKAGVGMKFWGITFLNRKPAHAQRIHSYMTDYTENLYGLSKSVHSEMLMKYYEVSRPPSPTSSQVTLVTDYHS